MAQEPQELDEDMMDLSEVGRTIDGEGFAYFQLDCIGKNVGSINILTEYGHLRQINLSKNSIKDTAPIKHLSHVLQLNLSSNAITQLDVGQLAHLMHLDLSENKLKELPPLQMPALKTASFSRNSISSCAAFAGHSRLESLNLSVNQLEALAGVGNMPMLKFLNVSSNNLSTLNGVCNLPSLLELNMDTNAFEALTGPWSEMPKLETLSAQSNRIAVAQGLGQLLEIASLKNLNLATNPLAEDDSGINARHEALIYHFRLKSIDGEEVTEEDREAATSLNKARQEEERQRKEKEEEDRRLAEQEAAEAQAAAERAAAGEDAES
jgi:Leucine-rich repeat (LRR) protein